MGTLSDVVAPLARTSLDADARPTKIETLKNICDAKHSIQCVGPRKRQRMEQAQQLSVDTLFASLLAC